MPPKSCSPRQLSLFARRELLPGANVCARRELLSDATAEKHAVLYTIAQLDENATHGTRGARETFLRGRKGRAAKNSVVTSGEKQLKC